MLKYIFATPCQCLEIWFYLLLLDAYRKEEEQQHGYNSAYGSYLWALGVYLCMRDLPMFCIQDTYWIQNNHGQLKVHLQAVSFNSLAVYDQSQEERILIEKRVVRTLWESQKLHTFNEQFGVFTVIWMENKNVVEINKASSKCKQVFNYLSTMFSTQTELFKIV